MHDNNDMYCEGPGSHASLHMWCNRYISSETQPGVSRRGENVAEQMMKDVSGEVTFLFSQPLFFATLPKWKRQTLQETNKGCL